MFTLIVLASGVISIRLYEMLTGNKLSPFAYIKHLLVFDLFINFVSLFIYRFILHGGPSLDGGVTSIRFLLSYTILNVIVSILMAFVFYFVKQNVKLSITDKEEKNDEEE